MSADDGFARLVAMCFGIGAVYALLAVIRAVLPDAGPQDEARVAVAVAQLAIIPGLLVPAVLLFLIGSGRWRP